MMQWISRSTLVLIVFMLALGTQLPNNLTAQASSHREAPYISTDPQADATDLYAFVSPDQPGTVTLIANYNPLQLPPAGPNFYKFGDDVIYELNIDNNGDAEDDISYQFDFSSVIKNPNTFLYNTGAVTSIDDADLNQVQTYSVSVLRGSENRRTSRRGTVLAENLPVAPNFVGPQSFPSGYGVVASQAVKTLPNGIKVFAGPRDDPFFVDLGGIFDLLSGIRGRDDVAGTNILTIAMQIPINLLTQNNTVPTLITDPAAIIGVRTTAYRPSTTVLRPVGRLSNDQFQASRTHGKLVQISRLDMPLVNEVVVPLGDKDRWNGSKPENDGQFLSYVTNPELAGLMQALLGVTPPPAPRDDLMSIFLTGLSGLNQPTAVVPSSQLRLNVAVAPTASPNRLGVIAGDNAGFPNGRRLADDVVDVELRAVAGGTVLTPAFNQAPNNTLADNVNANDVPFLTSFPYLQVPHDYTGNESLRP